MRFLPASFFALFLLVANAASGQHIPSFYLTDYTFSGSKPSAGYIRIKGETATIDNIKIEGAYNRIARVDNRNRLHLRKRRLQGNEPWVDVVVLVSTNRGMLRDTVRLVRDAFIRNKVIAHRGAFKNTGAAENSLSALQHAIRMGCEGSEFDVHMSADSVPVINHDADIQGLSIARTPASDLANVRLSNGEAMPTLEDYLRAGSGQNKTKLILEIKASSLGKESSLALTRRVVNLVERLHLQAWVDYISFDYDVCKEVMKGAPYAKVAYLKGDKTPAELAADGFHGLDYHFTVFQKNNSWIREAKEKKLTVNVWTVNDQPLMQVLLKEGVDFITTNEPEVLLKMVPAN